MNRVSKCPSGYWDREARAFDLIYDEEGTSVVGVLNRLFRGDMAGRLAFALRHAAVGSTSRILDVGCGSGVYEVAFARCGARVLGLDLSPRMVERAQARVAQAGVSDRCRFQVVDFANYATRECYDLGVAMGVFDYIQDPLPVLSKLLSCSDRVVASFPRSGTVRSWIRRVRLARKGCPVFFYREESLWSLAEQAGGVVEILERIGQLYCVLLTRKP